MDWPSRRAGGRRRGPAERGLDAAPTAPGSAPRGTGQAHTRPDPAGGTDGPSQRHGAASSDTTRLRVLWYPCAPRTSTPGPPGIDYTRDRVQTSRPVRPPPRLRHRARGRPGRAASRRHRPHRPGDRADAAVVPRAPGAGGPGRGRGAGHPRALVTALATPGDRAAWAASAPEGGRAGGAVARRGCWQGVGAGADGAAWAAWAGTVAA